jgi:surfeit locus 1 family protein
MKLPVWATIFTVAGIAVLCGLGTWQVKRLAWKQDMIARLDGIYAAPAADNSALRAMSFAAPGDKAALFVGRAALSGLYDEAHSILVGPRTRDGRRGYHLVTPLVLAGSAGEKTALLVNRGWVEALPARGGGNVAVTGLLRHPERPNMFVPPNDPARGHWYSINIDEIAGGERALMPVVLYADGETPAQPAIAYHAARPQLANNHRGYAVFWFTMAGVLALVYAARFLRPPRS